MYTHNPPEQFSLVTRAESTCVERCEPTKMDHPLPVRLKHLQVREASSGSKSRGALRGDMPFLLGGHGGLRGGLF